MATIEELSAALVKADAAGDAAGAKVLADHIRSMSAAPAQGPKPADSPSTFDSIKQGAVNAAAGLVRGAGSIGSTIVAPYDIAKDALAGKGLSLESNRQRRADIDAGLQSMGAEPDSMLYKGGKLAGEIAGTAGVGGVLANGARAVGAAPAVVNALATGGMRAGTTPGAMNMLTRAAGGAATGGVSAGLVDPSQAGAGAVIGGILPPVVAAAGGAGRFAKSALYDPVFSGNKIAAQSILRSVGADNAQQVAADLLRKAQTSGVSYSAGEASLNPSIAAIEDTLIAKNPGGSLAKLRQSNRNALSGSLISLAQDDAAKLAAEEARHAATSQLRSDALYNANLAGEKLPQYTNALEAKRNSLVSALQDAGKLFSYQGQQAAMLNRKLNSKTRGWVSQKTVDALEKNVLDGREGATLAATVRNQRKAEGDFIARQAQSLAEHGNMPLISDDVLGHIDSTLSKPGLRSSDVVKGALGEIKDKIASLTDKNGVINADDLYTIRKEAGNTITKYAKDSQNWDKRLTSGILDSVQSAIDDAIDKSSGGMWKGYIQKYAEMSKPIDQMKIGRHLADKLIPATSGDAPASLNAATLAREMRNPDQAARLATGFPNAKIENILTPDQMKMVFGVNADASRIAEAGKLGSGPGSATFRRLSTDNFIGQHIAENAPVINRLAELANSTPGINYLTKGGAAVGNMIGKGLNSRIALRLDEMLANDPRGTSNALLKLMNSPSSTSNLKNPVISKLLTSATVQTGSRSGQ